MWSLSSALSRLTIIFFFKQTTAYEMRISDWSSDVCSSDLKRSTIGCGSTIASPNFSSATKAFGYSPDKICKFCQRTARQQLASQHLAEHRLAPHRKRCGCRSEDRKSTRLNSSH